MLHECQPGALFQLGHQGRLSGGGGILGAGHEVMTSQGGIVHTLANVGEEVLKVHYLFAKTPGHPGPLTLVLEPQRCGEQVSLFITEGLWILSVHLSSPHSLYRIPNLFRDAGDRQMEERVGSLLPGRQPLLHTFFFCTAPTLLM